MHTLAAADPGSARRILIAIPAITEPMVGRADAAFAAEGLAALFPAAWTGVPYKIFAAAAGASHEPLAPFLAATFAARLPRFLFAALAVHVARRLLGVPARTGAMLLAGFWLAFYALYFALAG